MARHKSDLFARDARKFSDIRNHENPNPMKWEDIARQLTDAQQGFGKCLFAAIHSVQDGSCLGRYPKDTQGVTEQEIALISRAFRDPTMLYSSGISLGDTKFVFVKVEDNFMLGRTPTLGCFVMQTEKAYIVCIYSGEELAKNVHRNCLNACETMKEV